MLLQTKKQPQSTTKAMVLARPKPTKMTLSIAGAFLLACSLALFSVSPAFAAEETKNTTASVTFKSGVLQLYQVPTMNFGEQTLVNQDMSFASADAEHYQLKVNDMRGTGEGWDLTVGLSPFTAQTNQTTDSLPGAKVAVNTAQVDSDDTENPAEVIQNFTLNTDGTAQRVFFAGINKGMMDNTCTWNLTGSNVMLNIPKSPGITVDQHKADLVWTLTNGPTS